MPTKIALILLLSGASLIFSSARAATLEQQVEAAYAAWDAAFDKGDAKTIATFYTDDAILLPATHDVIEGPAAIEQFFTGVPASGAKGHMLEPIRVTETGNAVISAARWLATGTDKTGATVPFSGLATNVFEKQPDGSLKLNLHIFN